MAVGRGQKRTRTASEVRARQAGYKGVWPPNPLAIPGDPDYIGCCKQVDGEWQVDNTSPDAKSMNDDELIRRLHYIKDWQRSPEHKEVMRRRATQAA